MDKWLIEKYLKILGLQGLVKKLSGFNFRCPICGDSKKSMKKKRGWLVYRNNNAFIHCYNCGYHRSFKNFLKFEYPAYYDDFLKELYFENHPDKYIEKEITKNHKQYEELDIDKLSSLDSEHHAVQYIINRKIPKKWLKYLYFVDNYQEWINTKKEIFDVVPKYDPRIVIPIYNVHKKIVGVQGRSTFAKTFMRYITIMFDDDAHNICKLELLDRTKPIFVCEGFFDSIFLPNAITMNSSGVNLDYLKTIAPAKQFIFVFDNEPRNKENIRRMLKIANAGFQLLIWPKTIKEKDINQMILNGMTKSKLYDIILKNTHKGILATTKIYLI